ncbi:hypothetical protein ACE193_02635 [Bernardetia sp. OM2101]|uniref:hypothetical protein n=1 Tax=Bernardetia sp. OM2101 TaxID=3344876 RepID=UPI0035D0FA17
MSYHSHKLNSTHSHIIGRTDPITGDTVKENDKVVFCANCQSCFLEDSWIYMNESHCEQNQTLETVPALSSKIVARKITEELIVELQKRVNTLILGLLFTLISLLSFGFYYDGQKATLEIGMVMFLGSAFVGFTSGFLLSTNLFRKIIGFNKQDMRVFQNKLEIGKEIFYWKDIKQVKFQREMEVIPNGNYPTTSKIPTLFIYFHDETRQIKNLPTKDYATIELFLKGLAKISNFTEVYLYSEQSQEYIIIKKIKAHTKGNITVGEPFRLLADSAYPNQF